MPRKTKVEKTEAEALGEVSPSEKLKMGEGRSQPTGPIARYWREIERYNRSVSDWHTEGESIEKVYLDETRAQGSSQRKFALLWANVETLKPAVYAKLPTVLCSRRYKDKDRVARIAAELMERSTNTSFELYGVNEAFKMVRDDRLLPGRGQVWVRYEPTIESYDDPDGTIDADSGDIIKLERLASEKVCVDYVHWQDFGHNVSKTWADVWLVWRVVYKTYEEVAERFGEEWADRVSYSSKAPGTGGGNKTDDPDDRCKIYEVWDKKRGTTSWMCEGSKEFLDDGEPPLDFMNFFPCPMPAYATKTSKSMIPKADYTFYRDQAKEINDLTEKIGNMSQWLIVKGFVPAGPSGTADPIQRALEDKSNKELFLQVDSMADWVERGGASKLIDWLPIDMVQAALQGAITIRNQLIQDVFQITGISDILRGQTDPNETLGAQELKAQTGTKRLRNTRDEISRFCCDVGRLVAEVVADKFSPKSIAEITGYRYQPPMPPMPAVPMLLGRPAMPVAGAMPPGAQMPPQMLQPAGGSPMGHNGGPAMDGMNNSDPELVFDDEVMALLRNDKLRSFRIDIETDSTIAADEAAERAQRGEFLTVTGGFLKQSVEAIAANPALGPMMTEMLLFAVRGFRAGKNMEDAIESSMKAAIKMAQQAAAAPKVDPRVEVEKAKLAETAKANQADAQLELRKQNQDAQLEVRSQDIGAALEKRKQDLAQVTDLRHNQVAADSQARDRAAKLLGDLKPMGSG